MKRFDAAGLVAAVKAGGYTQGEVSAAMAWLAQHGFAPGIEVLLPHGNAKRDNSCALRNAAQCGHRDIVEMLVPHSDVALNNSQAMRSAAMNLHLSVVAVLLPYAGPCDAALAFRDAVHALANRSVVPAESARKYLDLAHMLLPHTGMDRVVHWCSRRPHKDKHLVLIDQAALDWGRKCAGVVRWDGCADALRTALPGAYAEWEAPRMQQQTPPARSATTPFRL